MQCLIGFFHGFIRHAEFVTWLPEPWLILPCSKLTMNIAIYVKWSECWRVIKSMCFSYGLLQEAIKKVTELKKFDNFIINIK